MFQADIANYNLLMWLCHQKLHTSLEMDSDSMGNTLRHNLANLARILAAPEN